MKKWQRLIVAILSICSLCYYLLIVILDFAFLGITMIWLFLAILGFVILFLDKKNKLPKLKPVTLLIISVVFCLLCVYGLYNLFFICNYQQYKDNEKVDYIILLGGGIKYNGEPTNSVKQRLQGAYDCWNSLQDKPLIIVTGGQIFPAPYPEAQMMAEELEKLGVEEKYILQETQAKDTIQNLVNSAKIINTGDINYDEAKVVLITSKSHIARSLFIAKRLGYTNIVGLTVGIPGYSLVNTYLREVLAICKLQLRILLSGKPSRELLKVE